MKKLTEEEKYYANYAIFMIQNMIERKHRLVKYEKYQETLKVDREFETLSYLLQYFLEGYR